jgi:formiminoglutamase
LKVVFNPVVPSEVVALNTARFNTEEPLTPHPSPRGGEGNAGVPPLGGSASDNLDAGRLKPVLQQGIALLGFPSDEGVRRNQGRVGAALAPRALRQALAPLAWHQTSPIYDAGDVVFHEQQLEAGQRALGYVVAEVLHQGHCPLVLGGGHETAWGTFQGLVEHIREGEAPAEPLAYRESGSAGTLPFRAFKLGVINLDAHFDLRPSSVAHSGTPFAQMAEWCAANKLPFHYLPIGISKPGNTAALWEGAKVLGVSCINDQEMSCSRYQEALPRITNFIQQMDAIYLSIDLDVLPASVMPSVSAPAGLGVPLEVILEVIQRIAATGKLVVADVVEYNPTLDTQGIGVRAAARIIWELCYHWKLPIRGAT